MIDNLLGAYFPERAQIVLYAKMMELAARDLGVEPDALGTVVYMHQTVHAFSHLGKDRDGRSWIDFGSPAPLREELILSPAHEGIAQYYTYRLIEHLRDEPRSFRDFVRIHSDFVCDAQTPARVKPAYHDVRTQGLDLWTLIVHFVRAIPVPHGSWLQAFGYAIEAGGRMIAVSGDTAPCRTIEEARQGCGVRFARLPPGAKVSRQLSHIHY